MTHIYIYIYIYICIYNITTPIILSLVALVVVRSHGPITSTYAAFVPQICNFMTGVSLSPVPMPTPIPYYLHLAAATAITIEDAIALATMSTK